MIGLKEAAGLIASAILLVSSLFVPAGDHGTVALESLDGDGTHAVAGSPVPIKLDGLRAYDLITSKGAAVPPTTLSGTIERVTGIAATTERPTPVTFGDQRLTIPPGAEISVEHLTGSVSVIGRDLGTSVSIEGTATDLTIEPPRHSAVSTSSGPGTGILVDQLSVDGRPLEPGFRDAGSFDKISFRPAISNDQAPSIQAGSSTLPIEEEVEVSLEDYVGVIAYVRISEDEAQLRLTGYGHLKVGGETIDEEITREASASLPDTGQLNDPPEANFTFRPTSPETGETVSFVDESTDDHAIRDWSWTFDDGTRSTAQHPEHRFPAPGVYNVTLTITDAGGKTDSKTRPVTVLNTRPHVDIRWEPLTPTDAQTVTFSANVTDRDGDVTSVQWRFDDGQTFQGTWVNRSFPDDGTYHLNVTATDSKGHEDTTAATVNVQNAPPIPKFGVSPTTPVAGATATLTSTSYDTGGGSIANWTWTVPGVPTHYGEQVEIEFPRDGPVEVRLQVADDDGETRTIANDVDVQNPAPSVDIDIDPVYPNPSQTVSFTAQVDDDDRPQQATWTFSDGQVQQGLTVERSFASGGDRHATVVVEDADGAETTAGRSFAVNHRPDVTIGVAGEGNDIQETALQTGETLDVSTSVSDPDGNTTTIEWRIDGFRPSEPEETACEADGTGALTCEWNDDGRRRIQAIAEDDNGATRTRSLQVIVTNRNPTLDPVVNATVVNRGQPVELIANADDADGTVETISWSEDDTVIGTGDRITHTFESDGEHTLVVNATDDDGAETEVSLVVDVNTPPTVDATVSPRTVTAGELVEFEASAVDPDGDDTALVYRWSFGDGDETEDATTDHVYPTAGTYNPKLSVQDEDGGYTNRTFTVDVDPPALNAQLTASPSDIQAGEETTLTVTFDGSRDVESIAWDLDDGTTTTTQETTLTHTFGSPTTYQITAEVQTGDGASDQAGLNLRVTGSTPHKVEIHPELPDGQCPDLSAGNVHVNLTNLATTERISLASTTDYTWDISDECTMKAEFPAGTWSLQDRLQLSAKVGTATTIESPSFQESAELIDPEFQLQGTPLDLEDVRIQARSNDAIVLDGTDDTRTYHDPLEPVNVLGRLVWADGTPADSYNVQLTARYDGPQSLLGGEGVEYRSWGVSTGEDGTINATVAAPVLAARPGDVSFLEPGATGFFYPPGRYDVRVFASSEFQTASAHAVFFEDPQGIFSALDGTLAP